MDINAGGSAEKNGDEMNFDDEVAMGAGLGTGSPAGPEAIKPRSTSVQLMSQSLVHAVQLREAAG